MNVKKGFQIYFNVWNENLVHFSIKCSESKLGKFNKCYRMAIGQNQYYSNPALSVRFRVNTANKMKVDALHTLARNIYLMIETWMIILEFVFVCISSLWVEQLYFASFVSPSFSFHPTLRSFYCKSWYFYDVCWCCVARCHAHIYRTIASKWNVSKI